MESYGTVAALVVAMALTSGCGASRSGSGSADGAVRSPFEEQVDSGAMLFADNCARCHGAAGEGTERAPRLVGLAEGALPLDPPATATVRTTQFVTVGDVATFAATNMPADAPGSLSVDQYLAILAFDLSANGIELEEELTLELAADLVIPREGP